MVTLEHLALKAAHLDHTRVFYEALGAKVSSLAGGARLSVSFGGGTRLFFDHSTSAPDVSAVTYLGLELDSFTAVDQLFSRLAQTWPVSRDLREQCRSAAGPYGFLAADPDGYLVKVFKYREE